MSRQLITEYRSELDRIHTASGSRRESVVREAFKDLLKRWGKSRELIFLAEHEYIPPTGNRCYIDGALVHSIRVPFGYWEAKDTGDVLDEEIRKKTAKGYPRDNIIYEDTDTAVLIQNKREVARVSMEDADALFRLLELFFAYERPEIADFRKAVRQFADDLPDILDALRKIIADKRKASPDFVRAERSFLDHAREAINPAVSEQDVQEMLIQHVLTEDIFAKVFDNPEFHRKNNVASELYKLEEKLFGYGEKSKLLAALRPYYAGIESTAALIESHSEKQQFLKGLYENFYKVYNPLAADRLGVVYTPGEIVRFMIRSADWLCHKRFGKGLDDRHVEILDPATGTGTFVVELLEHFRGNREKLAYKYREELHANEVAILPYYVANLNIEATYQAITGQFAEFPGLVFVDTLDNVDALGVYAGHQHDLLGTIADENAERIKRQNRRKISVIIGNPPYNVSQRSENENNKNRAYRHVDSRIKSTYVKQSMAQKTAAYDMYIRFYRWASDRLPDEGVLAFVSNRSFLDAQNLDGLRKSLESDFSEAWIVDLGGDVRSDPSLSGTKHNVFGIQTGIAIGFFVKRKGNDPFVVRYGKRPRTETAEDKLSFLNANSLDQITLDEIRPDKRGTWLNQSESDFENLIPVAAMPGGRNRSIGYIFDLSSTGIMSGRDEWVYDFSDATERDKLHEFRTVFQTVKRNADPKSLPLTIKWSRNLKRKIGRVPPSELVSTKTEDAQFRPFVTKRLPEARYLIDELGAINEAFAKPNRAITFLSVASSHPLATLVVDRPFDYGLLKTGNGGTQGLYRYRYTSSGDRVDNITDWALKQFQAHYGKKAGVTKDAIFAYCYAVLHDPVYRMKYATDLKREFPRLPFHGDFAQWVSWGQQLLKLHLSYDKASPFRFSRVDAPNPKRATGSHPLPKLKSEPAKGLIIVDEDTQLTGIPREAWDYRLGNRSAIDWVLDQYKEKSPRDPTIKEKFNTYRFADYKETTIDLLARVITVSVETMKIVEAMASLEREAIQA